MLEIVATLSAAIMGAVIGYVISRNQLEESKRQFEESKRQFEELIKEVTKILRPFDTITLQDEFYLTHILATQIQNESFVPDVIIAIAPGGAMIGEWLSRRFLGDTMNNIPMCTLWIDVERDENGKHLSSSPKVHAFMRPSLPSDIKNVLIVNDITRSGYTLEEAANFIEDFIQKEKSKNCEIKIGVLFFSDGARGPTPHFWVDRPSRKIVFKWKETKS